MGILRNDPRLAPLIKTLKTIRQKTCSSLYGIDNIKLDFHQFTKYLSLQPHNEYTVFITGSSSRAQCSYLRLSRVSLWFLSLPPSPRILWMFMKSEFTGMLSVQDL